MDDSTEVNDETVLLLNDESHVIDRYNDPLVVCINIFVIHRKTNLYLIIHISLVNR